MIDDDASTHPPTNAARKPPSPLKVVTLQSINEALAVSTFVVGSKEKDMTVNDRKYEASKIWNLVFLYHL